MKLHITDHAFLRMGDWHPDFKQFIPKHACLDYDQAQGVINGLHVFLASLESGRPSTRSEKRMQVLATKYPHVRSLSIFDRPLGDLYKMVLDHSGLTLVTVTWLAPNLALEILDEPHPACTFSDIDTLALTYGLSPEIEYDTDFKFIKTPRGRILPIKYSFKPKPPADAKEDWLPGKREVERE